MIHLPVNIITKYENYLSKMYSASLTSHNCVLKAKRVQTCLSLSLFPCEHVDYVPRLAVRFFVNFTEFHDSLTFNKLCCMYPDLR